MLRQRPSDIFVYGVRGEGSVRTGRLDTTDGGSGPGWLAHTCTLYSTPVSTHLCTHTWRAPANTYLHTQPVTIILAPTITGLTSQLAVTQPSVRLSLTSNTAPPLRLTEREFYLIFLVGWKDDTLRQETMRNNIAGSKRGVFPLLLKICVLIGLRTGPQGFTGIYSCSYKPRQTDRETDRQVLGRRWEP